MSYIIIFYDVLIYIIQIIQTNENIDINIGTQISKGKYFFFFFCGVAKVPCAAPWLHQWSTRISSVVLKKEIWKVDHSNPYTFD